MKTTKAFDETTLQLAPLRVALEGKHRARSYDVRSRQLLSVTDRSVRPRWRARNTPSTRRACGHESSTFGALLTSTLLVRPGQLDENWPAITARDASRVRRRSGDENCCNTTLIDHDTWEQPHPLS